MNSRGIRFSQRVLVAATLALITGTGAGAGFSAYAQNDAMPAAQAAPSKPDQTSDIPGLLAHAHQLYGDEHYAAAVEAYKDLVPLCEQNNQQLIDALQGLADSYLRIGENEESRTSFERVRDLLEKSNAPIEKRAINLRDIAATYFGDEKFPQAQTLCQEALTLQQQDKDCSKLQLAKTTARLGYSIYKQANYKKAVSILADAVDLFEKDTDRSLSANEFRRRVYHIAGGCYYHLKDFQGANRIFSKLVELDTGMFGPRDVRTGWALLALSDTEMRLGHEAQAMEPYRDAIWIFREWNFRKLCKEYGVKPQDEGTKKYKHLQYLVFGDQKMPAALGVERGMAPQVSFESQLISSNTAHDPWEALRMPTPDAPGLVWCDPSVPRKGILICVHGLSLHHGAYQDFAERMAPEGYTVIAFDIRGFGSYNQAYGAEEVDFDSCVDDLQSVIKVMRHDNPGIPIFLLGESMGGAISLRVASKHETLLDGLIASVPAGKRFDDTGMKFQVAKHLLKKRSRPFDIGTRVVRQATTDPELKSKWSEDPMVRLNMSPKELLRFQKLCSRNMESAANIKSIPVIVFQGMNDKLIRPDGTLQVFHALGTKDKDMIMLGNSEHLIFEEGQCPDDVLRTVIAWLNSRLYSQIPDKPAEASSSTEAAGATNIDASAIDNPPSIPGTDGTTSGTDGTTSGTDGTTSGSAAATN
jgi:alpha-beta hydrolase superfamily lysophospholipase/tetratricopeptide (TPR) repeat protein